MEDEYGVQVVVHDVLRAAGQVRLDHLGVLRPLCTLGDGRLNDVGEDESMFPLLVVEELLGQELTDEAGGAGDENAHGVA